MMIPSPLQAALEVKRSLAAAGMPPAMVVSTVNASTTLLPLWRAASDLWHSLIADVRRWQLRRATFAALYELDRRTLSDLGIDRCELWSVADAVHHGGDASRMPRTRCTRELPY